MYGTIILSVVLYGSKSWTLTLREESRLRTGVCMFENRLLRRIFGIRMDETMGEPRNCVRRTSIICTPQQTLL
jgi:hypothetical protein